MKKREREIINKLNLELATISNELNKYELNRIGKRSTIDNIQSKIKNMFEKLEKLEKILKFS